MGTRADFYVGRGEGAEWLGSIAWDGHPGSRPAALCAAQTEGAFRAEAAKQTAERDGTTPRDGWPWPWDDSRTTDYAYAFDGGKVHASCFGGAWFDPLGDVPEGDDAQTAVFPDMRSRKNVATPGSAASGVMVFTATRREDEKGS